MSLIKIGILLEDDLSLGAIIIALHFEKLTVSLSSFSLKTTDNDQSFDRNVLKIENCFIFGNKNCIDKHICFVYANFIMTSNNL